MTETAVATPSSPVTPPAVRRWLRRHRTWTVLGVVFVAALVLTAVIQLRPHGDQEALSIRNAAPDGARAVAEILGRHGVAVEQSASFESTRQAIEDARRAGEGSAVLLYDANGYLGRDQLRYLSAAADRLVVVTPRLNTLLGLDSGIRQSGVVRDGTGSLEPRCGEPDPTAAGAVSAGDGFLYDGPVVCYAQTEGRGGLYAASSNGRILVLGNGKLLSNGGLAAEGNAALALRSVGAEQRLIWYLPGIADVPAVKKPVTLSDLAAPWTRVLGPWLALVAVLAMFWRGRRLGPLVVEPLPVVVKAVETAEGRARLYHDARAVDRASDVLRAGTLVRLAKTLRLGPDAGAAAISDAAARHLDRSPESVSGILDAEPRTEADLVRWAQQLERLEKEVHAR